MQRKMTVAIEIPEEDYIKLKWRLAKNDLDRMQKNLGQKDAGPCFTRDILRAAINDFIKDI